MEIQDRKEGEVSARYGLHCIYQKYNVRISTAKTRSIVISGPEPVRSNTVISNKIIEQVSHFNYLGNEMGFNCDRHVKNKINKFKLM